MTRPDDLAVEMQVLAASMTDPGWRPTGWNRLRALSGTIHDQLASTPSGVFSRDAGILLHDGDRRWATPTREEMAASSIADARAVLDGPLARAPIEVIIVGDVDVEEAIRQTAATFGALPPRGRVAGAGRPDPLPGRHGRADPAHPSRPRRPGPRLHRLADPGLLRRSPPGARRSTCSRRSSSCA